MIDVKSANVLNGVKYHKDKAYVKTVCLTILINYNFNYRKWNEVDAFFCLCICVKLNVIAFKMKLIHSPRLGNIIKK